MQISIFKIIVIVTTFQLLISNNGRSKTFKVNFIYKASNFQVSSERFSTRSCTSSTNTTLDSDVGSNTHAELYYYPSVTALLCFGLTNILLTTFNGFIGSVLAFLHFLVLFEWLNLHGEKLTRKEVNIFLLHAW